MDVISVPSLAFCSVEGESFAARHAMNENFYKGTPLSCTEGPTPVIAVGLSLPEKVRQNFGAG